MLFVTLWLQCFIVAIGVYLTLANVTSAIFAVVFSVALVVGIVYALTAPIAFDASVGPSGHVEWRRNGQALLGHFGWLYLIGLFGPLILLAVSGYPVLWILIAYVVIAAVVIRILFPPAAFTSMWCYAGVLFGFLAWAVGMFA